MKFLKAIFGTSKPDKLSKLEYWEKWEFFELIEDLHSAIKILSNKLECHSGKLQSVLEFHQALEDAIDDIEFGNETDLTRFWIWFAPTCEWDDSVGLEGLELGNRIFERVDKWKKANS